MKKIILVIIFLSSFTLYAYDWESKNISKVKSENNVIELKDSSNNLFFIENESNISEATANKIISLKNQFYSLEYIKISKLKFMVKGSEIQIFIIPSYFTYDNTNVMNNVTAGLMFTYKDEVTRYNFRIVTKKIFLRISGVYLDEELFCKKVVEATKDPQSFIQRRDADYFLSKIESLEAKTELLELKLKRQSESQNKENEKLVKAIMAFQNDRFFAGSKPIEESLIEKVIDMKLKNDKITQKQIEEKLKAEKVKFSSKEIEIILSVYYNEFPK
jgi:hypothetical protein